MNKLRPHHITVILYLFSIWAGVLYRKTRYRMSRLWKAMKRIWNSTFNISKEVIGKAAKGTGSALGVAGGTAAAIVAVIVMAAIIVVILTAAIPWGIFGRKDEPYQEVVPEAV